MSASVGEWSDDDLDEESTSPAVEDVAAEPELYFGSVDEWVRGFLLPTYRRRVTGMGQGLTWRADWWRSAEAISRLDALWRAWEHLRLDPALGMSVWWRDHADHHLAVLMSPEGPFKDSQDRCEADEPLPYTVPPPGVFGDLEEESTPDADVED